MAHLLVTPTSPVFNASPPPAAPWWQTAVIYQVYPRSFQDSNADGIGDLPGITARLPYLQSLGVDCVWLSPFFRSPMADFGYDVADYTDVDPIFGTMADFDALLATAKALGIRVVVDLVPNHTSDQHPWFVAARSSRDNPQRDWYIWRDPQPDGTPPTNLVGFFKGSAWTLDAATGQYYLHMFLEQQPDLNWRNPAVAAAIHDVLRFWLDKGVDGFRLDAITVLIKAEPMRDLPQAALSATGLDLLKLLDRVHNQPELHPILKDFRNITDAYAHDPVLIGETNVVDFTELRQFYGDNDEIHLPMNLDTLTLPWDAATIRASVASYYAALGPGNWPSIVLGNHDRGRLATRYGHENHRSANLLLLTLWGVPTMYYGDEIGMVDGDILPEQRQDPFVGELTNAGSGRDPERTPMQWDTTPNAGFTAPGVTPWLPVATTSDANVAAQDNDPASTLNLCRDLLRLRRASAALQTGSIQFMNGEAADLLLYQRTSGDEALLVVINFGGEAHTLDLSQIAASATCLVATTGARDVAVNDMAAVAVLAHEGLLLRLG